MRTTEAPVADAADLELESGLRGIRNHARTEDEGRALIREMLLTSADILPRPDTHRLVARLHSLANPRSNVALANLCETLNALEVRYPGTDLQLVYEAPDVA